MPNTRKDEIQSIVLRAKKRRAEDKQWMLTFEELAHYFHSMRRGFVTEFAQAEDLEQDIWCSEPEHARRKLAEHLIATMCPKDKEWVEIRPARVELLENKDVRVWCQQVGKIMYAALYDPEVDFTERMGELADDISSFGTGVVYMDHDVKKKRITMSVRWLKDFSFESDGMGNATTTYCWYCWPLTTIIEEFGLENLPKELQEEYRDPNHNPWKIHEVLHIVMPNSEYAHFGKSLFRKPMKSLWVLANFPEHGALDEKGYYTTPYVVVRWYKTSREAWGRGPSAVALPDARLAQSVAQSLLEITEKQGNPPMQGPVDILRGEIELFPGGFTPFDSAGFQFQGDPLRPVQIGANPAMTSEYLQYLEAKIGKAFFADVLAMPEQTGKSTMEDAAAWQQRTAQVIGPIYSRVENETLPPILDRTFDILLRGRALPPIPEALIGERMEYHFDNYIAEMRDLAEAQKNMQGIGITSQFQRPEQEDRLNWDAVLTNTWRKMRVPESFIYSDDEAQENREAREQTQQAAQIAEIAKAGGPGIKSGVEALQAAQGQEAPAQ